MTLNLGPDVTTALTAYTIQGPPGMFVYDWQPGSGGSQNFSVTATGTYTLTVDNGHGCTATDVIQITFNGIGISENESPVNLYPNPANEQVVIATEQELQQVNLYDINGKLVFSSTASGTRLTIDTSLFAEGTYQLEVITVTGVSHRKIVVQH
jgi:hypothetical protein